MLFSTFSSILSREERNEGRNGGGEKKRWANRLVDLLSRKQMEITNRDNMCVSKNRYLDKRSRNSGGGGNSRVTEVGAVPCSKIKVN